MLPLFYTAVRSRPATDRHTDNAQLADARQHRAAYSQGRLVDSQRARSVEAKRIHAQMFFVVVVVNVDNSQYDNVTLRNCFPFRIDFTRHREAQGENIRVSIVRLGRRRFVQETGRRDQSN